MLEFQKLSIKLIGMMEKALKMESNEMEGMFEDGMQAVRMSDHPSMSKTRGGYYGAYTSL